MIKGIYTVGAGLLSRVMKIEVIGNNLANMNTIGFKKERVFTEVLNEKQMVNFLNKPGAQEQAVYQTRDYSEGSFQQTGNTLDFAIRGNGFFAIETPRGTRYTRNGSFSLSLDGTVVTKEGYPVLGLEGRIQLPDIQRLAQGEIQVNEAGEIMVDRKPLGKFIIVAFDDMTVLKKDGGNNLFVADATTTRQATEGEYIIHQGFLEESNVEGIEEMIVMIEMNRNFEAGQKSIQAQDETIERLLDVGRI